MLGPLSSPARRRLPCSGAGGLTLVELMVTLGIVAVLLAIAVPSMRDFIARKRLEGIAQELVTDLRLLKSHQIQNRPNTGSAIRFGITADKTCYILYSRGSSFPNTDCDCTKTEEMQCGPANAPPTRPAAIRWTDVPLNSGMRISVNGSEPLVLQDYNAMPRDNRTLVISVSSARVGEIRITTNATGAPTMCSVSGVLGAIKACSS